MNFYQHAFDLNTDCPEYKKNTMREQLNSGSNIKKQVPSADKIIRSSHCSGQNILNKKIVNKSNIETGIRSCEENSTTDRSYLQAMKEIVNNLDEFKRHIGSSNVHLLDSPISTFTSGNVDIPKARDKSTSRQASEIISKDSDPFLVRSTHNSNRPAIFKVPQVNSAVRVPSKVGTSRNKNTPSSKNEHDILSDDGIFTKNGAERAYSKRRNHVLTSSDSSCFSNEFVVSPTMRHLSVPSHRNSSSNSRIVSSNVLQKRSPQSSCDIYRPTNTPASKTAREYLDRDASDTRTSPGSSRSRSGFPAVPPDSVSYNSSDAFAVPRAKRSILSDDDYEHDDHYDGDYEHDDYSNENDGSSVNILASPRPNKSAKSGSRMMQSGVAAIRPSHGKHTTRNDSSSYVEVENNRIIVAISEKINEKEHGSEIGFAVIDPRRPYLRLCQMTDTPTYVNSVRKMNVFNPVELLVPDSFIQYGQPIELLRTLHAHFPSVTNTCVQERFFNSRSGKEIVAKACLPEYASVNMMIASKHRALAAAAALFRYIEYSHNISFFPGSIRVDFETMEDVMFIDYLTVAKLGLVHPVRTNRLMRKRTLFAMLSKCGTVAGRSRLRSQILQPFADPNVINARLDCVQELVTKNDLLTGLRRCLTKCWDVENLLSLCVRIQNIKNSKATVRFINYTLLLKTVLDQVPNIRTVLKTAHHPFFKKCHKELDDDRFKKIMERLLEIMHEDAEKSRYFTVTQFHRCYSIRPKLDSKLDMTRILLTDLVKDFHAKVEKLSMKYKLPLVVRVCGNAGYLCQLYTTKMDRQFHKSEMPSEFTKITLNTSLIATMMTTELIVLNEQIKKVLQEIYVIAGRIVRSLLDSIREYVGCLYGLCDTIAELDVLVSLARVSSNNDYIRPIFGPYMYLKESRHPVLDLMPDMKCVPNDIYCTKERNFIIITGPNASGKTVYIRQVILLQVMAQIGCYVPATYAVFRISDHLFARIGFSDKLRFEISAMAKEMAEFKYIFNTMTRNSLIVIDEMCRATTVEEGTGIAWAISEHLLRSHAFVFMTTHYLYLTKLQSLYTNTTNFYLETIPIEKDGRLVTLEFTHRLQIGVTRTDHYGINMIRLLNFPEDTHQRAINILGTMSHFWKQQEGSRMNIPSERRIDDLIIRLAEMLTTELEDEHIVPNMDVIIDSIGTFKTKCMELAPVYLEEKTNKLNKSDHILSDLIACGGGSVQNRATNETAIINENEQFERFVVQDQLENGTIDENSSRLDERDNDNLYVNVISDNNPNDCSIHGRVGTYEISKTLEHTQNVTTQGLLTTPPPSTRWVVPERNHGHNYQSSNQIQNYRDYGSFVQQKQQDDANTILRRSKPDAFYNATGNNITPISSNQVVKDVNSYYKIPRDDFNKGLCGGKYRNSNRAKHEIPNGDEIHKPAKRYLFNHERNLPENIPFLTQKVEDCNNLLHGTINEMQNTSADKVIEVHPLDSEIFRVGYRNQQEQDHVISSVFDNQNRCTIDHRVSKQISKHVLTQIYYEQSEQNLPKENHHGRHSQNKNSSSSLNQIPEVNNNRAIVVDLLVEPAWKNSEKSATVLQLKCDNRPKERYHDKEKDNVVSTFSNQDLQFFNRDNNVQEYVPTTDEIYEQSERHVTEKNYSRHHAQNENSMCLDWIAEVNNRAVVDLERTRKASEKSAVVLMNCDDAPEERYRVDKSKSNVISVCANQDDRRSDNHDDLPSPEYVLTQIYEQSERHLSEEGRNGYRSQHENPVVSADRIPEVNNRAVVVDLGRTRKASEKSAVVLMNCDDAPEGRHRVDKSKSNIISVCANQDDRHSDNHDDRQSDNHNDLPSPEYVLTEIYEQSERHLTEKNYSRHHAQNENSMCLDWIPEVNRAVAVVDLGRTRKASEKSAVVLMNCDEAPEERYRVDKSKSNVISVCANQDDRQSDNHNELPSPEYVLTEIYEQSERHLTEENYSRHHAQNENSMCLDWIAEVNNRAVVVVDLERTRKASGKSAVVLMNCDDAPEERYRVDKSKSNVISVCANQDDRQSDNHDDLPSPEYVLTQIYEQSERHLSEEGRNGYRSQHENPVVSADRIPEVNNRAVVVDLGRTRKASEKSAVVLMNCDDAPEGRHRVDKSKSNIISVCANQDDRHSDNHDDRQSDNHNDLPSPEYVLTEIYEQSERHLTEKHYSRHHAQNENSMCLDWIPEVNRAVAVVDLGRTRKASEKSAVVLMNCDEAPEERYRVDKSKSNVISVCANQDDRQSDNHNELPSPEYVLTQIYEQSERHLSEEGRNGYRSQHENPVVSADRIPEVNNNRAIVVDLVEPVWKSSEKSVTVPQLKCDNRPKDRYHDEEKDNVVSTFSNQDLQFFNRDNNVQEYVPTTDEIYEQSERYLSEESYEYHLRNKTFRISNQIREYDNFTSPNVAEAWKTLDNSAADEFQVKCDVPKERCRDRAKDNMVVISPITNQDHRSGLFDGYMSRGAENARTHQTHASSPGQRLSLLKNHQLRGSPPIDNYYLFTNNAGEVDDYCDSTDNVAVGQTSHSSNYSPPIPEKYCVTFEENCRQNNISVLPIKENQPLTDRRQSRSCIASQISADRTTASSLKKKKKKKNQAFLNDDEHGIISRLKSDLFEENHRTNYTPLPPMLTKPFHNVGLSAASKIIDSSQLGNVSTTDNNIDNRKCSALLLTASVSPNENNRHSVRSEEKPVLDASKKPVMINLNYDNNAATTVVCRTDHRNSSAINLSAKSENSLVQIPVSNRSNTLVVPVSNRSNTSVVPVSNRSNTLVVPVSNRSNTLVVPVSNRSNTLVVPVSNRSNTSVVPVSNRSNTSVVQNYEPSRNVNSNDTETVNHRKRAAPLVDYSSSSGSSINSDGDNDDANSFAAETDHDEYNSNRSQSSNNNFSFTCVNVDITRTRIKMVSGNKKTIVMDSHSSHSAITTSSVDSFNLHNTADHIRNLVWKNIKHDTNPSS